MAFKVEIFGRNLEVTDRIKNYVTKKTTKLDRFLDDIDAIRVDFAYVKSARSAKDRQVAQITVHGRRSILRTEERADDIFAAFDSALDKMQRQIERYKGKHHRGRGDGRSAAEVDGLLSEERVEAVSPRIARRKTFNLVPMSEAEALDQMEMIDHENFFIFYNADSSNINVLYRRRDGTYGLIEPKVV